MGTISTETKCPQLLWTPSDKSATNLDRFRVWINRKRKTSLKDYQDLHAWSTSRTSAQDFWIDLFEYQNLKPGVVPRRAFEHEVSV